VNPLRTLDDRLFIAVNDWARHTPTLHAWLLGYATYGVVLFAALMLGALVTARHRSSRDLAATGWVPLAMLIAVALNQPIGRLVGEARPYAAHPGILRLADVTTDFSFPSDHAVMAGAVAAGLLLAHRRLGIAAVVAALLMAYSRVYIAAHYPWDVLAGLLVGAAVALAGWALLRVPLTALTEWLRSLPGLRAVFAPTDAPTRITADLDELAVVPPSHLAGTGAVPQGIIGGRARP
jgi:membrane-associated phospholipid phosphatase